METLYKGEKRLRIDLGCGGNKQKGFIGMDIRPLPGVDIVQNIEEFPWPLEEECANVVIASHLIEHIKPWFSIPFMDECWRLLEPGGKLCLSTPYPGSRGFWQDPTHCNGWNEATFQYFDPRYPLYGIYKPKPWEIEKGFPVYQVQGNLEVILNKMSMEEYNKLILNAGEGDNINITAVEEIKTVEHVG